MQDASVLEKPVAMAAVGDGRLRETVLARIACAARGATKAEIAADLAPFARLPPGQWRAVVEREIAGLAAAGLASAKSSRWEASEAGRAQAIRFLGLKGDIPLAWSELRDVRLVARALGLQREPARRLGALATPEGLRAAIVERAFKLKIKGAATLSRLRMALAAVALERAFGNQVTPGLAGKLGLSAKASRLLAAQLAHRPRDFGTDARLIAALAGEHVGAATTDPEALRVALLQQFLDVGPAKAAPAKRPPARRTLPKRETAPAIEKLLPVQPVPPPATGRPDLAGFAAEVRRCAASHAQGWVGNRKAYISHVWHRIREERAGWDLSEIEFKCMLAEAHRAGALALVNADLKDGSSLKDLQESAVTFKNAVFHFIRVVS